MEMSFTPEQIAFRQEIRTGLREIMPPEIRKKADDDAVFSHAEGVTWHKALAKKGWIAPHWPEEHGGPGWDATRRFIFTEELELAGAPALSPFGLGMVGPAAHPVRQRRAEEALLAEDPERRRGVVPGLLASRTRAAISRRSRCAPRTTAKGDFVLNGQKTWTTYAQYADWIFCLVRTDPTAKKQIGHQLPPDRHEDARRDGQAVPDDRRHARVLRDVLREREGAEGEPGRPAQRRLDHRQGAARPRAHADRRAWASSARMLRRIKRIAARHPGRRQVAARRSALPREDRARSRSGSRRCRWRTTARWRARSSAMRPAPSRRS